MRIILNKINGRNERHNERKENEIGSFNEMRDFLGRSTKKREKQKTRIQQENIAMDRNGVNMQTTRFQNPD